MKLVTRLGWICAVLGVVAVGCDDDPTTPDAGAPDSGAVTDGGTDAGTDPERDSGVDGGTIDRVALPGDAFYPESITATPDGTRYVSSLATGAIVRIGADDGAPEMFVAATPGRGNLGVLADATAGVLYACSADLTAFAAGAPTSELRVFDLDDGSAPTATYPLPSPALCNDIALDGDGNVYVANSITDVLRLRPGGSALEVFVSLPPPGSATEFGPDGLVVDGNTLYVNTFGDPMNTVAGKLYRVPIETNGDAGTPVELTVTPALLGPDGMRVIGSGTLLVATGASGELRQLTIAGDTVTSTTITSGLDEPTSVAVTGTGYWITEGQASHFLTMTAPMLPFEIVRADP